MEWTETDLSANTKYERYIDAANDHGDSNSPNVSRYTLADPPVRFNAETISTSTINLIWNDSGASKYRIMYSTAGYLAEPVNVAATVASPAVSYKHSGLKTGTTYFYWIYPVNGDDIANILPDPPKASTSTLSVQFAVSVEAKPDVPVSATFNLPIGIVTINIEAGTFNGNVIVTISNTSSPSSDRANIKLSGVCLEINAGGQQPKKEIKLTIVYGDPDIAGLDEPKLAMGRYDPVHSRWIVLPSTVYPDENKILCRINHLSVFALLQNVPGIDLSSVKVYPNPFNPGLTPNGLWIENLTANADVKIYTIAGRLIKRLSDTAGDGRINWDGRNDAGNEVASGVYIGYIEGKGTKKIKIAVQR